MFTELFTIKISASIVSPCKDEISGKKYRKPQEFHFGRIIHQVQQSQWECNIENGKDSKSDIYQWLWFFSIYLDDKRYEK
jgi:hypothetical protein